MAQSLLREERHNRGHRQGNSTDAAAELRCVGRVYPQLSAADTDPSSPLWGGGVPPVFKLIISAKYESFHEASSLISL